MLEHLKGVGPSVVTLGAAGCLLSLLLMLGLKLRWFRARMTFDQPPAAQPSTYAGVYRSTFTDDNAFDYRRPSIVTPSATASAAAPSSSGVLKTKQAKTNEKKVEEIQPKAPKAKALTKAKEPKVKDVKTKVPIVKEAKTKEPKIKEVKTKEPKVKEIKTKEPKVKEVKTKEPKVKEVKNKEPKVKEPEAKDMKNMDSKVKVANMKTPTKTKEQVQNTPESSSQISQNNAFPFIQPNYEKSKPKEQSPLLQEKKFDFAPPKAPVLPNGMPQTLKTFGLIQPSNGQLNQMVSATPPRENRAIRNPAAMGMDAYKSPKGMSHSLYDMPDDDIYLELDDTGYSGSSTKTGDRQMFYDMDEESET